MEGDCGFLGTLNRFDKAVEAVHGHIEECHQHVESLITPAFNSSEARVQEIRKYLQPISARYKEIRTRASVLVRKANIRNEHFLCVTRKVVQDQISPKEGAEEFMSELHNLLNLLRNIIGEHIQLIESLRRAVDVLHTPFGDDRIHRGKMLYLRNVLTCTAIMSFVVAVVTVAETLGIRETLVGATLAQVSAIMGSGTAVESAITRVGAVFTELSVATVIASWASMASRSWCYTGALAGAGVLVTAGTRAVVKLIPLTHTVAAAGFVGAVSVAIKERAKRNSVRKDNEEHEAWIARSAGFTKGLDETEKSIQEVIGDLDKVDGFLERLSDDIKNTPNNREFVTKTNFKFIIKSMGGTVA